MPKEHIRLVKFLKDIALVLPNQENFDLNINDEIIKTVFNLYTKN